MQLNKLKRLVILADTGNFARAAEQLHISQPALSRSISELESELGVRLFDRDQAGAAPTAIGRQLVHRAQDLLFAAANLRQEIDQLRECEAGVVAFGMGPYPAAAMLHTLLAELARERPRMRTMVEVNNSASLTEHLISGQLEFFIADIRTMPVNRLLKFEPLARHGGGFFVRRSHPLHRNKSLKLSDLQGHHLSSASLPDDMLLALAPAFAAAPEKERPFLTNCDNIYVLRKLAIASDAVLLSTAAAVAEDVDAGLLVQLPVKDLPDLYAEIGIIRLDRRGLSPMAELVLTKTKDILARQPSAH